MADCSGGTTTNERKAHYMVLVLLSVDDSRNCWEVIPLTIITQARCSCHTPGPALGRILAAPGVSNATVAAKFQAENRRLQERSELAPRLLAWWLVTY